MHGIGMLRWSTQAVQCICNYEHLPVMRSLSKQFRRGYLTARSDRSNPTNATPFTDIHWDEYVRQRELDFRWRRGQLNSTLVRVSNRRVMFAPHETFSADGDVIVFSVERGMLTGTYVRGVRNIKRKAHKGLRSENGKELWRIIGDVAPLPPVEGILEDNFVIRADEPDVSLRVDGIRHGILCVEAMVPGRSSSFLYLPVNKLETGKRFVVRAGHVGGGVIAVSGTAPSYMSDRTQWRLTSEGVIHIGDREYSLGDCISASTDLEEGLKEAARIGNWRDLTLVGDRVWEVEESTVFAVILNSYRTQFVLVWSFSVRRNLELIWVQAVDGQLTAGKKVYLCARNGMILLYSSVVHCLVSAMGVRSYSYKPADARPILAAYLTAEYGSVVVICHRYLIVYRAHGTCESGALMIRATLTPVCKGQPEIINWHYDGSHRVSLITKDGWLNVWSVDLISPRLIVGFDLRSRPPGITDIIKCSTRPRLNDELISELARAAAAEVGCADLLWEYYSDSQTKTNASSSANRREISLSTKYSNGSLMQQAIESLIVGMLIRELPPDRISYGDSQRLKEILSTIYCLSKLLGKSDTDDFPMLGDENSVSAELSDSRRGSLLRKVQHACEWLGKAADGLLGEILNNAATQAVLVGDMLAADRKPFEIIDLILGSDVTTVRRMLEELLQPEKEEEVLNGPRNQNRTIVGVSVEPTNRRFMGIEGWFNYLSDEDEHSGGPSTYRPLGICMHGGTMALIFLERGPTADARYLVQSFHLN